VGYYRGDYYRGDYYQGDPFSLGGLLTGGLKAIGGLGIPGVSTLANVAGSIPGGSPPKPALPPSITPMLPPTFPGGGFTGIQAQAGSMGFAIGTGTPGMSIAPPNPYTPAVSVTPGGAVVPCQLKGYHPNKSTYYRQGQRIAKGSVCVKNRSMNVANGRALKRAIRRAEAFKKVAMRTVRFLNPTKKKRFGGFKAKKGR
jgi:hypothetical protein